MLNGIRVQRARSRRAGDLLWLAALAWAPIALAASPVTAVVRAAIRADLARCSSQVAAERFYNRLERMGFGRDHPALREFETEVLEIYETRDDAESRIGAIQETLEVDRDAAVHFVLGYDLDDWYRDRLDERVRELASLFPEIADWRTTLWGQSTRFAELLPEAHGRYAAFQDRVPRVDWLATLGDGVDELLLQDVFSAMEILRREWDPASNPEDWVKLARGKLAYLLGALAERRLLIHVPDLLSGAVVRLGGHRHADGWRVLRRNDGAFDVLGLEEVKASWLGYPRAEEQAIEFMARLLALGEKVQWFGEPIAPERLFLRMRRGNGVSLAALRVDWAAASTEGVEFVQFLQTRFPDDFVHIRVPFSNAKVPTPPFGKVVAGGATRQELLEDLSTALRLVGMTVGPEVLAGLWRDETRKPPSWFRFRAARGEAAPHAYKTIPGVEHIWDPPAHRFSDPPTGVYAAMQDWAKREWGGTLDQDGRARAFFEWLKRMSGGTVAIPEKYRSRRPGANLDATWVSAIGGAGRRYSISPGSAGLLRETWRTIVEDWNSRHPDRKIHDGEGGIDGAEAWASAIAAWDLVAHARAYRVEQGIDDAEAERFVAEGGPLEAMHAWASQHWGGTFYDFGRARSFFEWLREVTGGKTPLPETYRYSRSRETTWGRRVGAGALDYDRNPGAAGLLKEAWKTIVTDWNARHEPGSTRQVSGGGDAFSAIAWREAVERWGLDVAAEKYRAEHELDLDDARRFFGETGAWGPLRRWAAEALRQPLGEQDRARRLFSLFATIVGDVTLPLEHASPGGRPARWTATLGKGLDTVEGHPSAAGLLAETWRRLVERWNQRSIAVGGKRIEGDTEGGIFSARAWEEAVVAWELDERTNQIRLERQNKDLDAIRFTDGDTSAWIAIGNWAEEHWVGALNQDDRALRFFEFAAKASGYRGSLPREYRAQGSRRPATWAAWTGGAARSPHSSPGSAGLVKSAWKALVDDWNSRHRTEPAQWIGGTSGAIFEPEAFAAARRLWNLDASAQVEREAAGLSDSEATRFSAEGGGYAAMHQWSTDHWEGSLYDKVGRALLFFQWLHERSGCEVPLPESHRLPGSRKTATWNPVAGATMRDIQRGLATVALVKNAWKTLLADWNRRHPEAPIPPEGSSDTIDAFGPAAWQAAVQAWGLDAAAKARFAKENGADEARERFRVGALSAMSAWASGKWLGVLTTQGRARAFFLWLTEESGSARALPKEAKVSLTGVPAGWSALVGKAAADGSPGGLELLRLAWVGLVDDWNARVGADPERRIDGDPLLATAWERAVKLWSLEAKGAAVRADAGLDDTHVRRFVDPVTGGWTAINRWAQDAMGGTLGREGRAEEFFRWLLAETQSTATIPKSHTAPKGRRVASWTLNLGDSARQFDANPGAAGLVKASWDVVVHDWNRRFPDRKLEGDRYDAGAWERARVLWDLDAAAARWRRERGVNGRDEHRLQDNPEARAFVNTEGGAYALLQKWAFDHWEGSIKRNGQGKAFFEWLGRASECRVPITDPVEGNTWHDAIGAAALLPDTAPGSSRLVAAAWKALIDDWNARHSDTPERQIRGGGDLYSAVAWEEAVVFWDLEAKAKQYLLDQRILDPDAVVYAAGGFEAMNLWAKAHWGGVLNTDGRARKFFDWLRKPARTTTPFREEYRSQGYRDAATWSENVGQFARFNPSPGAQGLVKEAWRVLVEDWNFLHVAVPTQQIRGDENGGIFGAAAWFEAVRLWELEPLARTYRIDLGILDEDADKFTARDSGAFEAMLRWTGSQWERSLARGHRARMFFEWLRTVTECTVPLPETYRIHGSTRPTRWSEAIGHTARDREGSPGSGGLLKDAWKTIVLDWNRRHPGTPVGAGPTGIFHQNAWIEALRLWALGGQERPTGW